MSCPFVFQSFSTVSGIKKSALTFLAHYFRGYGNVCYIYIRFYSPSKITHQSSSEPPFGSTSIQHVQTPHQYHAYLIKLQMKRSKHMAFRSFSSPWPSETRRLFLLFAEEIQRRDLWSRSHEVTECHDCTSYSSLLFSHIHTHIHAMTAQHTCHLYSVTYILTFTPRLHSILVTFILSHTYSHSQLYVIPPSWFSSL